MYVIKCIFPYVLSIDTGWAQQDVHSTLKITSARLVKTLTRKRRQKYMRTRKTRRTREAGGALIGRLSPLAWCVLQVSLVLVYFAHSLLSSKLRAAFIILKTSVLLRTFLRFYWCLLSSIIYRGWPPLAIKSKERRRFAAKVPFAFDKRRERRDTVANEMMCLAEDGQVELR